MSRFETSTTLPQYFKEITQVADFMTKDEERELAARIQRGDKVALDRLVTANLKYVVTMANKFIGMGLPIDDLIQEGNLGLIEAAQRYAPGHDTKFLTYAKFWIRKRLNLALCDHGRTVRLPVNQEYQIYKDKIAGENVNLSNVRIDSKVGEDRDVNLGDLILHEDFNDPFENQTQDRALKVLLNTLKPMERRIVELFYGLGGEEGLSTKEVADTVGKTAAEVNRALKVARAKMRRKVSA
jgi:RNA polymerase primary sigma factor